jgi:hypothetical protein
MSLILDGTNGTTFNDGSNQPAAASPYVLKNKIINGDCRIDQRNAGASVALSGSSKFPVDRFIGFYTNTGGAATAQQSSVAPAGFNNSFLYSVTTGAAIGTGDYSCIQQNIEGYNVADLDFGSATAKTITLSFWVRSSLTGTFSGSLQNSAANRSYVYTYTISAANTWEQKTITIAGDTTGTWLKTNGSGLLVYWNMGFQSASLTSTTNTWVAGAFNGVTGGVTPSTTTGATFYITGVQLEQNTSATPFERRLYGTELALCQRYAIRFGGDQVYELIGSGFVESSTSSLLIMPLPVFMRSSPSVSFSTLRIVENNGAAVTVTGVSTKGSESGNKVVFLNPVAASGLTAGRICWVSANNSTSASLLLSAEL